ncbi:MAG: transaldolase [Solirubrobacterales bacterium]|nr:transaldolase [Solirubrobacterales bacterium]
MSRLHEITELGQAVWLDNINRELIEDGGLQRLIDEDGLSGVTSNPTIFKVAMGEGERYDDALRHALEQTHDAREVFFRVAEQDIRDAADILRPVFDATKGQDGYVSFELPPDVADDAEGSVELGRRFRAELDRPNVLIKVPGTAQGVRAFEDLTAAGVSVNVTLLFAVPRYEEVAEAYLRGLERRVQAGEPIDRTASVASFFVSRVDGKVDRALDERGRPELKGKAAIANAKLAYASFRRIFSGARWEALTAKGANVQRPLWASTSTKNPDYPDTIYVDELIGPDTVNTMPNATIEAARDHATPAVTIDRDVEQAHEDLQAIREAGVDIDDIVGRQLVEEGVASFADSFDSLVATIGEKSQQLVASAR